MLLLVNIIDISYFVLPPEIEIKLEPAESDIILTAGWKMILLRMLFFEFFKSSWQILTGHNLIGFLHKICLRLGIPYPFDKKSTDEEINNYMIHVIFIGCCDRGKVHGICVQL